LMSPPFGGIIAPNITLQFLRRASALYHLYPTS
jgi:hypothetical protein